MAIPINIISTAIKGSLFYFLYDQNSTGAVKDAVHFDVLKSLQITENNKIQTSRIPIDNEGEVSESASSLPKVISFSAINTTNVDFKVIAAFISSKGFSNTTIDVQARYEKLVEWKEQKTVLALFGGRAEYRDLYITGLRTDFKAGQDDVFTSSVSITFNDLKKSDIPKQYIEIKAKENADTQ